MYLEFLFQPVGQLVFSSVGTLTTILVFLFVVSPKLAFSQDILVSRDPNRDYPIYAVRIKKSGLTDLIDVHIECRLIIRDVGKLGRKRRQFYRIPTTFQEQLILSNGHVRVRLKIHEARLQDPVLSPKLHSQTKSRYGLQYLTFEDIFLTYPDATLYVFVLGHDRLTGIKKLFRSHQYIFANFRFGSWKGMNIEENDLDDVEHSTFYGEFRSSMHG